MYILFSGGERTLFTVHMFLGGHMRAAEEKKSRVGGLRSARARSHEAFICMNDIYGCNDKEVKWARERENAFYLCT